MKWKAASRPERCFSIQLSNVLFTSILTSIVAITRATAVSECSMELQQNIAGYEGKGTPYDFGTLVTEESCRDKCSTFDKCIASAAKPGVICLGLESPWDVGHSSDKSDSIKVCPPGCTMQLQQNIVGQEARLVLYKNGTDATEVSCKVKCLSTLTCVAVSSRPEISCYGLEHYSHIEPSIGNSLLVKVCPKDSSSIIAPSLEPTSLFSHNFASSSFETSKPSVVQVVTSYSEHKLSSTYEDPIKSSSQDESMQYSSYISPSVNPLISGTHATTIFSDSISTTSIEPMKSIESLETIESTMDSVSSVLVKRSHNTTEPRSGMSRGVITLTTTGCVVFIFAFCVLIFVIFRSRARKTKEESTSVSRQHPNNNNNMVNTEAMALSINNSKSTPKTPDARFFNNGHMRNWNDKSLTDLSNGYSMFWTSDSEKLYGQSFYSTDGHCFYKGRPIQ